MTINSTRIQGNYQESYIGYHSCNIRKIFLYFTVAKYMYNYDEEENIEKED